MEQWSPYVAVLQKYMCAFLSIYKENVYQMEQNNMKFNLLCMIIFIKLHNQIDKLTPRVALAHSIYML